MALAWRTRDAGGHRPAVGVGRRRRAAARARVARADRARPPGARGRPAALPRRRTGRQRAPRGRSRQRRARDPAHRARRPDHEPRDRRDAGCSTSTRPARRRSCALGPLAPAHPARTPSCSCTPRRASATASTSPAAIAIASATPTTATRRCRRARSRASSRRCGPPRSLPTRRTSRACAPARAAAERGHPPRARPARRVGPTRHHETGGVHMPRRTLLALLGVSATLAAPVAAGAEPYQHTTQATATGSRRRRRHGRQRGHRRRARGPAPRRQRRRRGGRRRGRARRDRAVLVRHRRRRLHGHPHRARQGHDDRLAREGAGGDAARPRSSTRTAPPLPFADARYSGLSGGVPGTVAGWDKALRRYGTWSLRKRAPAGDRRRPPRLRDRPDLLRAGAGQRRLLRRHPQLRGALPRSRTAPRTTSGTVQRNPDLARAYERIAQRGADGFYRGPIAEALGARGPAPAAHRRTPTTPGARA